MSQPQPAKTIQIPLEQCRSLTQALSYTASALAPRADSLKLIYIDARLNETEIESDADLISLKYLHKSGNIPFTVISTE